ncbi:DNA/RNA-binding protein [Anaerocolumna cellulosilytica]|uniref:RNA-binding protein KhpB n=1 Tax=Anaerocolumna cellulosilytica TaxID=433286 RepID=A0A6S6RDC0_9FIRM|nr:RNA-binding cell elongation regulator Jag/EloR [Anaerocolumna cellulosilytica]MBB5195944.1 spoIIIJ-associated protein [Anaerocolumna cellulosilytica]BCJ96955.1 DNA/RNA-binding protein [Anaerocolumna cellulosilytica]
MEWLEITAKTVDEAITDALIKLRTTSDRMDYEVIEKESSGFLGLFNKPAKIRVRLKNTVDNMAKDFLDKVFKAMNIEAQVEIAYDETSSSMDINVVGDDMGVLIGKRGQTLDSLQYLVSLVLNKESENYLKVKMDTENYRQRRKETLENLGRNIAYKVKRTKKSVSLEPMNPYERRIIHSALQNDKYVETHSEGEEPFRRVVITLKKGAMNRDYKGNNHGRSSYNGGQKDYSYNKHRDYSQKHSETE